jgi:MinD-like ATPase involved in chromosome partitioning or flagellar assembly
VTTPAPASGTEPVLRSGTEPVLRSGTEPAIALVFSPEAWVERFHRHVADHGGARVRQIVLDPALALDEAYDALVVSHRWPGLTRPFVAAVRAQGRVVLGVFDPDEPAGRDHLVDLGADAVVSADASPDRFVEALGALATSPAGAAAIRPSIDAPAPATSAPVAVTGIAGAGVSEIALGMAARSARRSVVLVDAQEHAPSLAARLGLPFEPGIRQAIDAAVHGDGDVRSAAVPVARGLHVVAGFPSAAAAATATSSELVHVLAALGRSGSTTVVDVAAAGTTIAPAVLRAAGVVVVVAPATPVAVTRLLGWFATARPWLGARRVHVVFNRAPRERFRRAELEHELTRTFTPEAVWFVPTCRRVDDAVWRGAVVGRGPFSDAVARLARVAVADAPTVAVSSTPPLGRDVA